MLTQAIITAGMKVISMGHNPMTLRKGLEESLKVAVSTIKNISKPVSNKEEKAQVATISAQDEEIGKFIAEAIEKVGNDGIITVEESRGFEMELNYKEGMQIDKGYLSPYFITNTDRMEAVIENPYILITENKISTIQDIMILDAITKVTKNIVIIAEDVSGDALTTLVYNKLRGTINLVAIKAPGFGDRRKEMLEDIAVLTGGNVISSETGRKLENATIEDLGRADRIIARKEETLFIGGKGDRKVVDERVVLIKKALENTDSSYDKEKLQERLAKLAGGVAVISVGASTESELKEKKLRVEDAINATKAAVEEGIVPGGGVTLLRIQSELEKANFEGDIKIGASILKEALDKPFRVIVENAGEDSGKILAMLENHKVQNKNENFGYNVMTMSFVDMIEEGIIDPAKVTRSALQNAVSASIMILTTECLIADLPKEKEDDRGATGMPDMGMM